MLDQTKHPLNDLVVQPELRRDRADLPVLGEVQTADLRLLGLVEGSSASSSYAADARRGSYPTPTAAGRGEAASSTYIG